MGHLVRQHAAMWIGALGLAACGGIAPEVQQQLDDSRRRMETLQEAHAAQTRQLDDLRERLALLEDRTEANELQAMRRPTLPVVRMTRPESHEEADTHEEETYASSHPPATITQAHVDALGRSSPLPAPPGGGRVLPRNPVEPPPNASRAGNIGVVPLTPSGPPPSPSSAVAAEGRGPADPALSAFRRAKALYDQEDLASASHALTDFVQRFPRHGYADNALYLLGQCRFRRAEYAGAVAAFRRVIAEHPTGNKVPDALLMIGLTQERLGQQSEGRETLARLRDLYPDTDAGRRAAAQLQRNGHL